MEAVTVSEANRWASKNGSYRFVNVMSKSCFGTVLQARRGSYGPVMAVHLVEQSDGLTINPREMEGLRGLRHESIVEFVESYPCQETYQNGHVTQQQRQQPPKAVAIVLEYCRSGDLASYLRCYRIGEETRLRWYADLANGLRFLHSRGVLHNDLRPENVWIKDDKLKLVNVGLASSVWKSKHKHGNDQQYCIFIREMEPSQPFLAPEVWEEEPSCRYTTHSEVFSLGMLFLVTCESPDGGLLTATWGSKKDFLGRLLHSSLSSRTVKATHMITPPLAHSQPQEIHLFDWLLQYESDSRPDMDMVVNEIAAMKVRTEPTTNAQSSWCTC